MTKYLFILLAFSAFNVVGQSYNRIDDPSAVKQLVKQKVDATQTIKGDFTEEVYSSMFNSVKENKGTLRYAQSDKIRWEHLEPKQQIVLINGAKMRMQEDGKEIKNASTNQVIKKVQSLMMQLFNGDFLNEKDFFIGYYENNSTYRLVLVPKSNRMSKYISKIKMTFDKENIALQELQLIENEEDKIVYTFDSVRFNESIPESQFNNF